MYLKLNASCIPYIIIVSCTALTFTVYSKFHFLPWLFKFSSVSHSAGTDKMANQSNLNMFNITFQGVIKEDHYPSQQEPCVEILVLHEYSFLQQFLNYYLKKEFYIR